MPKFCRWLRSRDLSRCPGLSCRKGRVVPLATRMGQVVPVTLIIKEQEDEAGECFHSFETSISEGVMPDLSLFSSPIKLMPGRCVLNVTCNWLHNICLQESYSVSGLRQPPLHRRHPGCQWR